MSAAKIGAAGLLRLTTATAVLVASLLSVVPAGAYFAVKYTEIRAALDTEANINAGQITQLFALDASARNAGFTQLLAKRHKGNQHELRRILDAAGAVIAESADPLGAWRITVRAPSYFADKKVAEFEVSRSVSEFMGDVVGILIVSLWFATWSYLILRTLPDRALKNALSEASAARELAHSAMLERDKAEEAARLRSVFLANMSHELRTPMNGVLGMVDLISDTALDDEQKEYVRLANLSARDLLTVINDILDFSKIDEGNLAIVPATFHLPELLTQVLGALRPEAEKKGISLEAELAPGLPAVVYADPVRVRQILVNLLGNAIKFTAEGQVQLKVVEAREGNKKFIDFTIKDSGIGIAGDKLEYIFHPFTQADESATRRFGGTGLGLAISRQLAVAMGGKLWAASELGQGSVFHLRVAVEVEA